MKLCLQRQLCSMVTLTPALFITEGYGHVLFNFARKIFRYTRGIQSSEFPIILGRDFVGEVISVGSKVNPEFTVGSVVMGVTLPPGDGSHAEYVVAYDSNVSSNFTFKVVFPIASTKMISFHR